MGPLTPFWSNFDDSPIAERAARQQAACQLSSRKDHLTRETHRLKLLAVQSNPETKLEYQSKVISIQDKIHTIENRLQELKASDAPSWHATELILSQTIDTTEQLVDQGIRSLK